MTSDEEQIRRLVAAWIEATKRGDVEGVLDLMTDDVVFLVPGQQPMIGKAAFAAALNAQVSDARPQFEGTSEIQEIVVTGDWAYMWTKLSVTITPGGDAPPLKQHYSSASVDGGRLGGL